jgi:hypothetical protein
MLDSIKEWGLRAKFEIARSSFLSVVAPAANIKAKSQVCGEDSLQTAHGACWYSSFDLPIHHRSLLGASSVVNLSHWIESALLERGNVAYL